MTQIGLLTTDRVGGIIPNAIEGETRNYNGTDYLYKGAADTSVVYDEATDTTVYTAKLRVGMMFSDGTPVTADDVIFTYYTYLDPSYVGSTTLGSYDIVGLKDYQTQTTSDVFDRYAALVDEIYAAGRDHEWSDADAWTMEQQDDFWAKVDEAVLYEAQKIVDYVDANYRDAYAEAYTGFFLKILPRTTASKLCLVWSSGASVALKKICPSPIHPATTTTSLKYSPPLKTTL